MSRASFGARCASFFSSGSAHDDPRTEAQLERERYLCWHPRTPLFRRWMAIPPCIAAQMVLGSFYSTSVFNKRLDHDTWGAPGVTAGAFVCCVASYGAGTLLLGNWIGRNGAFASVRRSLFLTPLGWATFSLAARTGVRPLLYVYGVLHGLGCAHSYISTASCLGQWWPESKGLMAGVAVFGAGLGSYVCTLAARAMMDPRGAYSLDPAGVMATFSVVFAVVLLLSLLPLRNPPPHYKGGAQAAPALGGGEGGGGIPPPPPPPLPPPTSHRASCRAALSPGPPYTAGPDATYTFLSAMKTREWALTAALVFATSLPGVVFLSSAADMAANVFKLDSGDAALVTSYLNLVNFTGRFAWGAVTDAIGRKSFWLLSAALQAGALAAMVGAVRTGAYGPWLACFLMVGSLYGGGFGVLPAFLADMFGAHISSATHGAAIAIWAFACVCGAPLFSAVNAAYAAPATPGGPPVPTAEGYVANALWLCCVPLAGLLAAAFLNVRAEDRAAEKRSGSWRARCCARVLVLRCGGSGCGAALLGADAQAAEYRDGAADAPPKPMSEEDAARDAAGLAEWGVSGAPRAHCTLPG
jgi:hypothetical protein